MACEITNFFKVKTDMISLPIIHWQQHLIWAQVIVQAAMGLTGPQRHTPTVKYLILGTLDSRI